MPVSFAYQVPSFRIKNKKQIRDWILLVAYLEQKQIEKVDFVFCDDDFLFELNKKFLRHKTLTDIITFDYSDRNKVLTEIYISIPRVKENATSLRFPFKDELHRVMIHGVLHCMGYDDKSDRAKKKMRKKEDEYLRLFSEM